MKKLYIAILNYQIECEAESIQDAEEQLKNTLANTDYAIKVDVEDFTILEDTSIKL